MWSLVRSERWLESVIEWFQSSQPWLPKIWLVYYGACHIYHSIFRCQPGQMSSIPYLRIIFEWWANENAILMALPFLSFGRTIKAICDTVNNGHKRSSSLPEPFQLKRSKKKKSCDSHRWVSFGAQFWTFFLKDFFWVEFKLVVKAI